MAARKDRGKKKSSTPKKKASTRGNRKRPSDKAKKKRPAVRRAATPKGTEKKRRRDSIAKKTQKGRAGKAAATKVQKRPAGGSRGAEGAKRASVAKKPNHSTRPAPAEPRVKNPPSKQPSPERAAAPEDVVAAPHEDLASWSDAEAGEPRPAAASGEEATTAASDDPDDKVPSSEDEERELQELERKAREKRKLKDKDKDRSGSKRSQSGVAPRPSAGGSLRQQKFIGVPSFTGPNAIKYTVPPPPPAPKPPPPPTIEERTQLLQERLAKQSEEFRQRYLESLDMSWTYHDSALEGVVYSFQELKAAIGSGPTVVQDSNLQPVCEDIRRHKAAIEFIRDYAKKRLPITVDVTKRIYLILHPEEGDIKTVKYRKDIPQHRLYFHEYAPPDKIAYKVRQIVDWLNDPETKRGRNALRIAARAHYDFLRAYPFPTDSGKVARLLMNLLLMRAGYEPSIIHSTERQRYYEALKGSAAVIIHMVQEAQENALASIEKLLDEHETNTRSFVS